MTLPPRIILNLAFAGFMLAALPAEAAEPSFDCGDASNAVEELVCGDDQLAAMDKELARLYRLAQASPNSDDHDKVELVAGKQDWIDGRNQCADADNPRACVETAYVTRIAELRETYADIRSEDDKGISLGPFDVACPGMEAPGTLIFVNADPSVAYLAWPDWSIVLTQTMSGSGARYAAEADGGEVVFWNKGNDATFSRPGKDDVTCSIAKAG